MAELLTHLRDFADVIPKALSEDVPTHLGKLVVLRVLNETSIPPAISVQGVLLPTEVIAEHTRALLAGLKLRSLPQDNTRVLPEPGAFDTAAKQRLREIYSSAETEGALLTSLLDEEQALARWVKCFEQCVERRCFVRVVKLGFTPNELFEFMSKPDKHSLTNGQINTIYGEFTMRGSQNESFKLDMIYPCLDKHILKALPSPLIYLRETPEQYQRLHLAQVAKAQMNETYLGWVYAILKGAAEAERVFYHSSRNGIRLGGSNPIPEECDDPEAEAYVFLPNDKWSTTRMETALELVPSLEMEVAENISRQHEEKTHSNSIIAAPNNPELSSRELEGRRQREEYLALRDDPAVLHDIYGLAIVKQHDLSSIRDLRGKHLPLLRRMLVECKEYLSQRFGISSSHIKAFFHYPPSYYHLHIHFVHTMQEMTQFIPGRSIYLEDVIENLELDGDYYAKRTLSLCIPSGHPLAQLLVKDRHD